MKKIISIVLVLALVISQLSFTPVATSVAAGSSLIIHYQRSDEDYGPWNLWLWAEGGEGEVIEFEYEDDYGKVAVIPISANVKQYGFIVRTNDWAKDVDEDRFITIENGSAEVWLTSGEAAIETKAPEGYSAFDITANQPTTLGESATTVISEDGLKVRVHYHRYDENYEGWNMWLWPENGDGAGHMVDQFDEFGAFVELVIPNVEANGKIGLIARLNDWEAKDIDEDRFLEVSKTGDDGILDVWLLQGDSTIYYDVEAIDLSPKFISAKVTELDQINIAVTLPFVLKDSKDTFEVQSEDGKIVKVKHVTTSAPKERVSAATVILEEALEVGKKYKISKEGYGSIDISMSEVFGLKEFVDLYAYEGDDLGFSYSKEKTEFKVWAPTATKVDLLLYKTGDGDNLLERLPMVRDLKGIYTSSVSGDQNGVYYTYEVTVDGKTNEAVDPYARTTGVNGDRAMVLDLESTNPEGWESDKQLPLASPTDAIIYELHVRDLSTSANSGIEHVGKFLGLTEEGTTNDKGLSTGLDHLKELGITHLHLLPSFDYRTIDETKLETNQFNWGYDPENYNTPEGSYSTDPYNGEVRVKEFKTMVKTLHDNQISVVMDVVYNHTGATADSNLNKIVPNYYYRTLDGIFANGSGCGNETASERIMVRKMIVDSVVYWAKEYHIDGFRFDLMGLHDIETMNAVRKALDEVDPSIIIYGEGWTGGASPLPDAQKAIKINTSQMPGIAAFSDDLRDGIKGHVFSDEAPGFVNGHGDMEDTIKFGVVGATLHNQVSYGKVNYSKSAWASAPTQTVNYAEAHDNLTLYDKLTITNPEATKEEKAAMVKLSNSIVFMSQGIPFIHAGMEMLRTKDGDENSYNASDEVNQIDWSWKSENIDVFNYHKGLIEFRKAHPALRMTTTNEVQQNLSFFGEGEKYGQLQSDLDQMVSYIITNHANDDEAGTILVAFNANTESKELTIPDGEWKVMINKDQAGTEVIETINGNKVTVEGVSTLVLVNDDVISVDGKTIPITEVPEPVEKTTNRGWLVLVVGLVGAIAGYFGYKKFGKRKNK